MGCFYQYSGSGAVFMKTTLLYFAASWCGPCHVYGPVLDKIARDFEQATVVQKIDVDANASLVEKYSITAVPTVVQLDATGEEVKRYSGAVPYKKAIEIFSLEAN